MQHTRITVVSYAVALISLGVISCVAFIMAVRSLGDPE
jgi:hypothetical protein